MQTLPILSLNNDNEKEQQGATTRAALFVTLNSSSNTILEQEPFPNLNIDGLKDINKHLDTAKKHAKNWMEIYSKEQLNSLQRLMSFGELYYNLYTDLYNTAKKIGNQNEFNKNEISNLIQLLQALQSQVSSEKDNVDKIIDDLNKYIEDVNTDITCFKTDRDTANKELISSDVMNDLQKKIDNEREGFIRDGIEIVGGLIGALGGVVCVCVGVAAEPETGGASTILVKAGVALIVGGVAATVHGTVDYISREKQISNDLRLLFDMKSELGLLETLNDQLDKLSNPLTAMKDALTNLSVSWNEISNSINSVILDLQCPETYLERIKKEDDTATPSTVSILTCAYLKTANDDWKNTVDQVKELLRKCRNIVYVKTDSEPTQDNIAKAYNQKVSA